MGNWIYYLIGLFSDRSTFTSKAFDVDCYNSCPSRSTRQRGAQQPGVLRRGAHGSGPDGTAIFAYDCDDTGNCQQDGCFSGPGGYTTCCCGSNQCNSSPMLASFIGITSVVFAKLLLLRS
ncbi:hypothetical protein Q1695_006936 [Nippostrongylus brasiliensis]|nr:hypothetical protein Q1695_006936 [Nippostrongylus brasiliensis]